MNDMTAVAANAIARSGEGRATTILVVEDSSVQAELLRRAIEGAGYRVIVAGDGAAGLAQARAQRPAAVVSDINMPVMDGYAMCTAIRRDETLKAMPVILLTMLSDPEDVIRGLNAGADAYLTKPYNIPSLLARLALLLAYPPVSPPEPERRRLNVQLAGEARSVDAHGPRMLNLLLSTYENAVLQNRELTATQQALEDLNQQLEQKVLEKTAEIRENEQRFRALIENASDLVLVVDAQGRITYVSPSVKRVGGYEPGDLLGKSITAFIHPDDIPTALADLSALVQNPGKLNTTELRYRGKEGDWIILEAVARSAIDNPAIAGVVVNARDITERKRAEQKIARLNRLYATLSGINMAIVRAASPADLFERVCAVAVEQGRFDMAWFATIDPAQQVVQPVTQRGLSQADMALIRDAIGPVAQSQGRTASAIRERRTIYGNYDAAGHASTPWNAQAVKHGIRGSATLPIDRRGEIVGVLKLYVREPNFFDSEQMALLEEMRGDISYALDRFDTEAKKARAEAALRDAETRYRGIFAEARDGIVLIDAATGLVTDCNPEFERQCGRPLAQLQRMRIWELRPSDAREKTRAKFEEIKGKGGGGSHELPLERPDGTVVPIEFVSTRMRLGDRDYLQSISRDITERNLLQQEQLRSAERLKNALIGAIGAVALTLEKRDPYTAGHQQRVAELSTAIGRQLELPQDRLEGLRLGATIHDIGKISIPAEILSRPGKISALEFDLIKSHPQVGYEIVKDVKFPWPVMEMILQHHERLDGSGYPQGLKGEQAILEARIIAVADVVEAMSSHRPYRPGLGLDKALAEIERGRGILYDPVVADTCLKLFREQRYAFPG